MCSFFSFPVYSHGQSFCRGWREFAKKRRTFRHTDRHGINYVRAHAIYVPARGSWCHCLVYVAELRGTVYGYIAAYRSLTVCGTMDRMRYGAAHMRRTIWYTNCAKTPLHCILAGTMGSLGQSWEAREHSRGRLGTLWVSLGALLSHVCTILKLLRPIGSETVRSAKQTSPLRIFKDVGFFGVYWKPLWGLLETS